MSERTTVGLRCQWRDRKDPQNQFNSCSSKIKEKFAIATALSGIAATLLTHGRTLHSRCKVPLNINETFMCSISLEEAIGILFQKADLLITDEISMGHKHVFEAIDRTMQDLRKNTSPFGGLTVLLAGDWRQILPVVRHGSRMDIVEATLKASYIVGFFALSSNVI
ncbi:ATP-dependent DNA helicase pif1 [Elysia marginata]|uniref:ATP-dependent DNA helicase n=1 Tax=Elysia marginata TaxID=1093978 RepID=A0AAV4EAL5_9GAST|nr:ATP-dependent DNA helicase pif1 [Elysia marginata]